MPAYPVPTLRRISYDADGTQGFEYNTASGLSIPYTATILKDLNTSNVNGQWINGNSTWFFGSRPGSTLHEYLYFPGPRDILAVAIWAGNTGSVGPLQYSTDSLTPGTGTWTTFTGYANFNGQNDYATATNYRTKPTAQSALGVVAVRFVWFPADGNSGMGALHLYGGRSSSDTARQVAFVDSGGARVTKDFDYGDVGQGATTLKWKSPTLFSASDQLYVKNFGAQIANAVVVSAEIASSDGVANMTKIAGDTTLSLDDVTYTATETFTTIAPGASAGPLFVKYSPLSTDPVSVEIGRAKIAVGSWT